MNTDIGIRSARDLMKTDVITVRVGTTLRDAAQILSEEHVHGVPVVDLTGAVVGVLSGTDLATAMTEEISPHAPAPAVDYGDTDRFPVVDVDPDQTVEHVMSTDVISAGPTATAGDLAAIMGAQEVHRVLILDDGALLGIVSTTDLLPCLAEYENTLR